MLLRELTRQFSVTHNQRLTDLCGTRFFPYAKSLAQDRGDLLVVRVLPVALDRVLIDPAPHRIDERALLVERLERARQLVERGVDRREHLTCGDGVARCDVDRGHGAGGTEAQVVGRRGGDGPFGPMPEWDLSDLYPSMNGPEVKADLARAEERGMAPRAA